MLSLVYPELVLKRLVTVPESATKVLARARLLAYWALRLSRGDVVVFEGLPMVKNVSTLVDSAMVEGVVRAKIDEALFTVAEMSPASLKLYLAGHGDASKDDMKAAAWDLGCHTHRHDIADAFGLARAGLWMAEANGAPGQETQFGPALPGHQMKGLLKLRICN